MKRVKGRINMSKMTNDQLKQLQALPLNIKIRKTEQRIREWYEHWEGNVYVSFSGGKDSTVLLDIVRNLYPKVPAVFSDTGLEYPEIKEFVKTFPNVIIVRPKHSFKEILTKYGYPIISKEVANTVDNASRWIKENLTNNGGGTKTSNYYIKRILGLQEYATSNMGGADREWRKLRGLGEYANMTKRTAKILGLLDKQNNIRECAEGEKSQYSQERWAFLLDADFKISDRCCYHMKKSPIKKFGKQSGLYPMVATMASESRQRKTAWLKTGCNAFEGTNKMSKPMSFWTEQDVLQYIDVMGLEVAPVYGNLLYSNGKYYFDGCQRTGCIFCGFGCHLEKEPNRFQRLKETHPKLYDYCMGGGEYNEDGIWQPNNKGLGMKHVMDFMNVKVE